MILVGLVKVITTMFFAVLGLLPHFSPPSAVESGGAVTDALATIGANAGGLSAWIDVPQFAAALTVILAGFGTIVVIWIARKVLSLVTLGKVS